MVMTLMFYGHDREDIQFEINHLASCVQHPYEMDVLALKRLCIYLLCTRYYGVLLRKPADELKTVELKVWTDSDWSGDTNTRKSQTSMHITADGCPMSGISCRQNVISLSGCEAE